MSPGVPALVCAGCYCVPVSAQLIRQAALTCWGCMSGILAAAAHCLVPNSSKQSWPDAGWHTKRQGLLPLHLLSSAVSLLEGGLGPFIAA